MKHESVSAAVWGHRVMAFDQVTPTLASRGEFSTADEPMEDIVVKIAELVGIVTEEEADALSMASGTR